MMTMLIGSLSVNVVLLFLQWRPLKKSSSATRVTCCLIYALSTAVFVWIQLSVDVPRPAVILEYVLRPFDIVR